MRMLIGPTKFMPFLAAAVLVGAGLTFFQPRAAQLYTSLLLVALVAGLTVRLLRRLVWRDERTITWLRVVAWAVVGLVATGTIIAAMFELWGRFAWDTTFVDRGPMAFALLHGVFVLAFVLVPFVSAELAAATQTRAAERDATRLRITNLERSLALTELKTMQAQIEPHFLYNVLANVQSMVALSPLAAQEMLDHLIRYLKLALPNMRTPHSPLGVELELSRAYLGIAAMRFGERLQVSVTDKTGGENIVLPPMLLLPLVENAVKHGAEPKPGPVRIEVTAHLDNDDVVLAVLDTGAGFSADAGSGVGLANVRERLAALFQSRAELLVEPRIIDGAGAGVIATLRLPRTSAT